MIKVKDLSNRSMKIFLKIRNKKEKIRAKIIKVEEKKQQKYAYVSFCGSINGDANKIFSIGEGTEIKFSRFL
ncbi:MAG: hypothetical protein Athens101410_133 [Parcubacteria group bacterium Athens1014_10]|nr:MAG: hypothetical protein Athens101410_133 [Parcubacteria group bacterium Athens1014_10]TSD05898.1 MAG: hypothetical protein Athens071412_180 [Parcubacteria group bacterium Athens0714_12]